MAVPILHPGLLGYIFGGGTEALIGLAVLPVGLALAEGLTLIKPEKTKDFKLGEPIILPKEKEYTEHHPTMGFDSKPEEEKIKFELEQDQR